MSAPVKEYIIHFVPENCIQCLGCETACKSWRELPHGIQYRRVFNLWEGNYPKVKSSSISIACLHCIDPECMHACPVNAISKSEKDGRVLVDETVCIGCKACTDACPFDVPQFGNANIMQKCDLCLDQPLAGGVPPCVDTCPGKALMLIEITPAEKKAEKNSTIKMMQRKETHSY